MLLSKLKNICCRVFFMIKTSHIYSHLKLILNNIQVLFTIRDLYKVPTSQKFNFLKDNFKESIKLFTKIVIFLNILIIVYIFTQPLYMSKMWHKINFQVKLKRFWIQSFSSPRPVAIPRLKSSIFPTIYS